MYVLLMSPVSAHAVLHLALGLCSSEQVYLWISVASSVVALAMLWSYAGRVRR